MRFIYERGLGNKRRVVHLCGYDTLTGEPTMQALCGEERRQFNTSCNLPLGQRVCKRCQSKLVRAVAP